MITKVTFSIRALILGSAMLASASSLVAQTIYQWNGTTNGTFGTTTNWSGTGVMSTTGTSNSRLNVNNTDDTRPLTFSSGTPIYSGGIAGTRSLVIASGSNGSMVITGGTFDSRQPDSDVLVNGGWTGSLTINGGNYINTNGGGSIFLVGLNASASIAALPTLNITNGTFATGSLQFGQNSGIAAAGITGVVNLDGGILTMNFISEQGSITTNGVTNSSSVTSTFNFNGGTLRVGQTGTIMEVNAVDSAVVKSGGAIIDTNTFNTTIAKALTAGAPSGGLTKQGTGILTLTAANTYTGTTTISAGTLALDATGTINNTSGVVLGGGTLDVTAKGGSGYNVANLSGNGSVAGTINVTTQLAMGGAANAATINFANLALTSGTTAVFDLTGGGSAGDLGDVSGSLNLASATLDLVQLGTYTLNNKFTLFAYDGALSGTFSGLIDGATFNDAGGQWQIDYNDTTNGLNGGTGSLFVTVTAIPEPTAALLGSIGALLLLRRRRH